MRIEAGKYYRTRDGRKVGPGKDSRSMGRFEFDGDFDHLHEEDGTYCGTDRGLDIISEWADEGPVRTVTRQEIVPGTYNGVVVIDQGEYLEVRYFLGNPTPDELERAAAVLTALAGALRDGN